MALTLHELGCINYALQNIHQAAPVSLADMENFVQASKKVRSMILEMQNPQRPQLREVPRPAPPQALREVPRPAPAGPAPTPPSEAVPAPTTPEEEAAAEEARQEKLTRPRRPLRRQKPSSSDTD
jgi:hypothetical protein